MGDPVAAPVVLSWEAWREVDARYGLGSLKQGLAGGAGGWSDRR